MTVTWKVSTTSSIATLGSQLYVNGSAKGTELVNTGEPTSDTTQSYAASGLSRADLLNGALTVRVRATRGNSNTAFTASLDAVSVQVDYTTPVPGVAPSYDDNGNLTADGTYGNRTYAYDTLGRLTSVVAGGATTSYALDGAGNRWSETTGSQTTNFDLDLAAPNPTILFDGSRQCLPRRPPTPTASQAASGRTPSSTRSAHRSSTPTRRASSLGSPTLTPTARRALARLPRSASATPASTATPRA